MELVVNRFVKSELSSIGRLSVDGQPQCFTLEDKDRGLKSTDDLSLIKKLKVFSKTAIPTGRYQVVINFSNRFKTYLPLLLEVPGYAGVRIHPGNTAENTEGCILPGESHSKDFVSTSRKAFTSLMAKMKAAEKKEKIYITIN